MWSLYYTRSKVLCFACVYMCVGCSVCTTLVKRCVVLMCVYVCSMQVCTRLSQTLYVGFFRVYMQDVVSVLGLVKRCVCVLRVYMYVVVFVLGLATGLTLSMTSLLQANMLHIISYDILLVNIFRQCMPCDGWRVTVKL